MSGERSSDPWSGPSRAVDLDRVEVLVLTVGDREHALPVGDVIEVVRMVDVTPLPEAPAWVAGVINMRGRIVAVIDLRMRLGMSPRKPELSTPIIVVGRSEPAAGLIADGVSEVLALASEAVEPRQPHAAPALAVSGMAHAGDRLIVLLDPKRLCDNTSHLSLSADADARADAGR